MKRFLPLILILALLASCLALPAEAGDVCYVDVPRDAWYYSAVRQSYEQGLLDGTSDSTFSPEADVTRGDFIMGMGRAAGINTGDYTGLDVFRDVPALDVCAPYAAWAKEQGITEGTDGRRFRPNDSLTLEQMILMVGRFLRREGVEISPEKSSEVLATFSSTEASPEQVLELLRHYSILPGDEDDHDLTVPASRAEAARLLIWLGKLLWDDNAPVVNIWQEYVPVSAEAVPSTEDPILSGEEIAAAAERYDFTTYSAAWQALCAINQVYGPLIPGEDRLSPLVFLFEGAGTTANPGVHMNAMCVVVRDGAIVYLNRNCTTIPDDPFDPQKNDGTPMPTLCSGIYRYSTLNQSNAYGAYAALNVEDAQVVRFEDQASFYPSTSTGINLHRRNQNEVAPAAAFWGNSVGCCLIGAAGREPEGEYAAFIEAVGLVDPGSAGDAAYQYKVSGTVVVDRSFGRDYLRDLGYPDEAIDLIG